MRQLTHDEYLRIKYCYNPLLIYILRNISNFAVSILHESGEGLTAWRRLIRLYSVTLTTYKQT